MAAEGGNTSADEQVRTVMRRATVGRTLAAFAVFAPVLVILGGFVLSRGSIYNHAFSGPKWPWIVADIALLLTGMRLMRGEDL